MKLASNVRWGRCVSCDTCDAERGRIDGKNWCWEKLVDRLQSRPLKGLTNFLKWRKKRREELVLGKLLFVVQSRPFKRLNHLKGRKKKWVELMLGELLDGLQVRPLKRLLKYLLVTIQLIFWSCHIHHSLLWFAHCLFFDLIKGQNEKFLP